jgi:hypothetical protein
MFVGAAVAYGVGWHGRGHDGINIERNVNISGNTINRGSSNSWHANRAGGRQVGRPGRHTGANSRTRNSTRAGARSRPNTSATRGRTQPSRSATSARHTSNRTGKADSFGGYKHDQTASRNSRRGNMSRSRTSRSRRSAGRSGGAADGDHPVMPP